MTRHLTIMVYDSERPKDPVVITRDIEGYNIDIQHKLEDITPVHAAYRSLRDRGLVVTIDLDSPKYK